MSSVDVAAPRAGTEHVTRPVAVVDIGATAIRMAVAEIQPDGDARLLEQLSRGVNLGKDTFTRGEIGKATIEECVGVLSDYLEVLSEYQIETSEGSSSAVRVVATSAVREASNSLAFVDRVYSATRLAIEVLDEAEVTRVTYLSVLPILESKSFSAHTAIVEVGGGSTEVLLAQGTNVLWSHSYRLGSLRLRETLETYHAPISQTRLLMEDQIRRTVEEVARQVPEGSQIDFLASGGDIRIAADALRPNWHPDVPERLSLDELRAFTTDVLDRSVEDLVHQYHLTFPEAETLGPAMLVNLRLAEAFGSPGITATKFTLRSGLLEEIASPGFSTGLRQQVVASAWDLARKFDVAESHARHVAELGQQLFEQLADEHRLDERFELTLYLAALLHEAGLFLSHNSFHKHTSYLVRNSEIFGLGRTDMLTVSLVARYHRRASPKPDHDGYASLDRERRLAVAKLSAILRVADALDRSRSGRVQRIRGYREARRWVIEVPGVDDLSLERLALDQKGSLFEEVFGMSVLLRHG